MLLLATISSGLFVGYPLTIATNIASALLYMMAIAFPLTQTLVGLLIFSASSLHDNATIINAIRIIVFSLLFSFLPSLNRPPSPFIALATFWLAILCALMFNLISLENLGTTSLPQLLSGIYIEIAIILLASIALKLLTTNRLSKKSCVINTSKALLLHMVGLPTIISIPLIVKTVQSLSDLPISGTNLQSDLTVICFSLFSLILITIASARLINLCVQTSLTSIVHASTSSTRESPSISENLLTEDILQHINMAQKDIQELKSTNSRNNYLLASALRKLKRKSDALNFIRIRYKRTQTLANSLPEGMLLLSEKGYIIECNKILCQLLEIRYKDIKGKHFSYLKGAHIWSKELAQAIDATYLELSKKSNPKPWRTASSGYQNHFLEIVAVALKPLDRPQAESGSKHVESNISVALFVQKKPDLRSFIMHNLLPNRVAILGSSVIAFNRKLHLTLEQLLTELNSLIPPWALNEGQFSPKTAQVAITTLRKGLEDQCMSLGDIVADIDTQLGSEFSSEKTLVNLTESLVNSLELFMAYKGEYEKPIVQNVTTSSGETQLAISSYTSLRRVEGDVFLLVIEDELSRLLGQIIALLCYLECRSREIVTTICYETLSADSCRILQAARPGTYVRLSLNLSSKGLADKLSRRPSSSVKLASSRYYIADSVIELISMQLKRMGGFFTIQSSNTKGATMTFYLPHDEEAEKSKIRTRPEEEIADELHHTDSQKTSSLSVLVVGHKDQKMVQFQESLVANNCRVTIQPLGELLSKFEKADLSSGQGFDQSSTTEDENDNTLLFARTSNFDIVFLELPEKDIRTRLLYQFLRNELSNINTVILASPHEPLEELRSWARFNYPIPLHQLHSILEKVRDYKNPD